LNPAKPSKRDLAGGTNHQSNIRLISNQYLHLVVEQKGIVLLLFDLEDKKLAK